MQRFLPLAASLFMLVSCVHDPFPYDGVQGNGQNPLPTDKPCHPDTVYFQNTILPLLVSNCTFSGCHSGSTPADGILLTNYTSIISGGDIRAGRPGNSDLYEVITETRNDKRMPPPPYPQLRAEEIAAVRAWIEQGAKNNGCDDCDTANVTFAVSIAPVFQKNCEGCHGSSNPSGGVSLTNHNQIEAAVITKDLLELIKHTAGYKAMPPGIKISDCEIRTVEAWVKNGMPNN